MPVRLTPIPAPDEMLTMRPHCRAFMPGAVACAIRKAPVRLTSKIACQSLSPMVSSGRPVWPSTPPALLTRMSTRPPPRRMSATMVRMAAGSVTSRLRGRQAGPAASTVSGSSASSTSQANTSAPAAAGPPRWRDQAHARRRSPPPSGLRDRSSWRRSRAVARASSVARSRSVRAAGDSARRPSSISCTIRTNVSCNRHREAMPTADRNGYTELRIDLGLAFAHREIAPDPRMGLRRSAVMGHHVVEGSGPPPQAERRAETRWGRTRRTPAS